MESLAGYYISRDLIKLGTMIDLDDRATITAYESAAHLWLAKLEIERRGGSRCWIQVATSEYEESMKLLLRMAPDFL